MSVEAYPLSWPAGRRRTPASDRKPAQWKSSGSRITRHAARKRIIDQADRFTRVGQLRVIDLDGIVVSTNIPTRKSKDGFYADDREPADPGVAIYFEMKGRPHCLSCDRWSTVADNLASVAAHMEAMRGMLRWGVADIEAMFAGYKQLPPAMVTPEAMSATQAQAFLERETGIRIVNTEQCRTAIRAGARKFHPDANGGRPHPLWNDYQAAVNLLKPLYGI